MTNSISILSLSGFNIFTSRIPDPDTVLDCHAIRHRFLCDFVRVSSVSNLNINANACKCKKEKLKKEILTQEADFS